MDAAALKSQLEQIPFYSGLNESVRRELALIFAEISEVAEIPRGKLLFHEGEPGSDQGYILLEGEIEIEKSDAQGSSAFAPDLIGEMKLFNPTRRRTATVKAATDLKVCDFKWSRFIGALRERMDPESQTKVKEAIEGHAWQHFTD